MKIGDKLYVLVMENDTDCSSEGFIPFEVEKVEGDSIHTSSKFENNIKFIKQADGNYRHKQGIKTLIGVKDIALYHEDKWKMRDDEYIDGVNDHIEDAYELKVKYKNGEVEYYEAFSQEHAEDMIRGINNIEYAAFTQQLRLWKDSYCSEWENGEVIEYTEEEIKALTSNKVGLMVSGELYEGSAEKTVILQCIASVGDFIEEDLLKKDPTIISKLVNDLWNNDEIWADFDSRIAEKVEKFKEDNPGF